MEEEGLSRLCIVLVRCATNFNVQSQIHRECDGLFTNAFSKKVDNHVHMLAIYFAFYNFCRIRKSLRVTPAMAAGLTDRLWTLEDIVAKTDHYAPAPKARGPWPLQGQGGGKFTLRQYHARSLVTTVTIWEFAYPDNQPYGSGESK